MENDKITNPLKAIRARCLECCLDQTNEAKLCPAVDCPLWPFRLGTNPFRKKRVMTEEQRAAAAENLRNARNKTLTFGKSEEMNNNSEKS